MKKSSIPLLFALFPFASAPSFAEDKDLKAVIAVQQAQITEVLRFIHPVGSVMQSFLTEEQFTKQMGTNWVLADGRSVAGSDYEKITGKKNVPDVRGRFLRSSGGNGASLAEAQEASIQSHSHSFDFSHGHGHQLNTTGDAVAKNGHNHEAGNLAALIGAVDDRPDSLGYVNSQNNLSNGNTYSVIGSTYYEGVKSHRNHNTDVEGTTAGNSGGSASISVGGGIQDLKEKRDSAAAGGAETRPANVSVNTYVRVN